MHRIKFLLIHILMIYTLTLGAQDLVDVTYQGNLNRGTFAAILSTFLPDLEITSGVDLYRITYTTIGSDNLPDTASGLLDLPDTIIGPMPIINYQHGTTDGRNSIPSNLTGQEYLLASAFSTVGFISFAPDYIGMGSSRGFHPYVHPETEARAMVDMLSAIKTYLDEQEIEYTKQLFITGYSQGGHGAASAQRMIEEQLAPEITVTASLPMSGPYDISGIMIKLLFSDQEYFFPSYFVYSTLSLWTINPELFDDITEVFNPDFIDAIRPFYETGEGLGVMNRQLLEILERDYGGSFPRFMYQDSILNIIQNDLDHPFNEAISEYDVYDWTPKAPTLMLYCEGDDQVPFINSLRADSVMNANGAADVNAVSVEMGIPLDHGECIVPALKIGVPWLLSFLDNTVSVYDISVNSEEITVYPNPSNDRINIRLSDIEVDRLQIIDLTGRILWSKSQPYRYEALDISQYSSGIYFLRSVTEDKTYMNKIIIE